MIKTGLVTDILDYLSFEEMLNTCVAAARALGDAMDHVHAKDVRMERGVNDIHGLIDEKTMESFATRSWNYVALGHRHDVGWWKEFFTVVKMSGYEGPIVLEMEDLTMAPLTGVKKSIIC